MWNRDLGRVGDGDDPRRAVGEGEIGLAHRELGGKLLDARGPKAPRQQDRVGRAGHHRVEIGIGLARIERHLP